VATQHSTILGLCGRPALLASHGEAVSYAASGTTTAGTAIVQDRGTDQAGDLALFTVSDSFVSAPATGHYFTWDSRQWRVEVWQRLPGSMWEIYSRAVVGTRGVAGGIR
jgi:hypothetical protein